MLAIPASLALAAGLHAEVRTGVVRASVGVLNLRTGDVPISQLPDERHAFTQPRYLVVLDGAMTATRRLALAQVGVVPTDYFPTHAFLADLRPVDPARLSALPFVARVVAYDRAWKLDPALAAGLGRAWETPARQALESHGRALVALHPFAGVDPKEFLPQLSKLAQVVLVEPVGDRSVVYATIARGEVARLPDLPDLQFAEEYEEFSPRSNAVARAAVQTDTTNQWPFHQNGVWGLGQILGIIDGRMSPSHCSFFDTEPVGPTHRKVLAYNASPTPFDLHGMHVSTTALGDAGDAGDGRGVAYGAKMVFNVWPDATEPGMYSRFSLHSSQGARVHSNSWGDSFSNAYTGTSRAVDAWTYDHEDELVVFAVANTGTVQLPENAKNCVGVSASGRPPSQNASCFGATAPTADGRQKPDLMATGCNVFSGADQSCGFAARSGTSIATPVASGAAVLARQYYMEGRFPGGYPSPTNAWTPSGALLKATLAHATIDMTNFPGRPGPAEGWGRIALNRALDPGLSTQGANPATNFVDRRNTDVGALTTGESFRVHVPSRLDGPLAITLAWTDAPAAVNASFTPVNNLDLVVTAPDGTIYYGNVVADGISLPGEGPDPLNNLERVLIPDARAHGCGVWTVDVAAASINFNAQGFALLYSAMPPRCWPDFDDGSGTGTPDGGITIDDLIYVLNLFDLGSPCADFDDGSGTGNPEGGVTVDDLLYYIARLDSDC